MLQTNKAIAAQFLDAIGSGDVETVKKLATNDLVTVTAGKSEASGTWDFETLTRWLTGFPKIMPGRGIRFEYLNFSAEDNRVACEARGYAKVVSGEDYNNTIS
jgi:ketosteroid isomerase-like protein